MSTCIVSSGKGHTTAIQTNRLPRTAARPRAVAVVPPWAYWAGLLMLLTIALLLVPGAGSASAAVPAHSRTNVTRDTLSNGLQVVIVRNPLAAVVTTVVNYKVGANETPEGFPGTAHAQEHMMFRGSPGLSAAQLADINAALGGRFNADTQQAATQYFFTVPAEYLDVALHIEAIRMSGVLDTEALWQQERGAIEQEVARDLSSPEYVFYTRLLAAMFQGTPYAHDALGSKASFDATSGAMLKRFYDTWYAPNNAVLVIAGDVDPAAALSRVKALFGGIPRKTLPERPAVTLKPVKAQTIRLASDLPYSMAILAFRMPGYDSPDYAASQVLADVLDSRRGKLFDLSVQGKVLDSGFQLYTMPQSGIGFVTATFPQSQSPDTVMAQLRSVLARQLDKGVDPDLVAAARRRETAQAEFRKNSVSGLAMTWSHALVVEGRNSPQDDIDRMARVTAADVNRTARRYLDFDHAITAILTPEASGQPVRAAAGSPGGPETFSMPQNPDVQLPEWAHDALQRLTLPRPQQDTVRKQLPNGITLIVQPTAVSRTVSIYGRVRTRPDLQVPKGLEGMDNVLNDLFDYGTRTLKRQAFQKALDDIGADVSAGTDFSLQVLESHFDRGAQLLADNLLHPAMPPQAFEIVRKQEAAVAAGNEKSPGQITHRTLLKALFPPKDPVLRRPTPDSVKSLTLPDVQLYYQQVMRPDETVMVVIGNITPEAAESVVRKYFGGWQALGPKPDLLLPKVPSNPAATLHVPDKSRIQDRVVLAETLDLTRADPDYYALNLGNHVLGGGFYATRLYRDLREKTGLVYSVDVDMHVDRSRAVYAVAYACDPGNVNRARTIVARNIEAMQARAVTPAELKLAKAMLLRRIPLAESSLSQIARGYIQRVMLDLPLDEPVRAARHYAALTADDVAAAFIKWLRPRDWAQVTEGPAVK